MVPYHFHVQRTLRKRAGVERGIWRKEEREIRSPLFGSAPVKPISSFEKPHPVLLARLFAPGLLAIEQRDRQPVRSPIDLRRG
jgi:hypothetical protein